MGMNEQTKITKFIKSIIRCCKTVPWHVWILIAVILIGVFLRTYRFHDWLEFRQDQARDAYLTDNVIDGKSPWPIMGPKMAYTGAVGNYDETGAFHLGPMYYYFQIISAKVFGNYPDRFAYPDVFFSILSIPLLYFFLRIYFSRKLSLSLAGLYAISAYFISYSRLAWNSNSVPFFALLLLFSLYKFLEKNEETSWIWVILTGIALGVGFQLHAISMVLFPITAFFVFLYSMKKNRKAWKKWAVVILIFLALNSSQIINEARTNFSNTKSFFNFPMERNSGGANVFSLAENDLSCHIAANFLFLSSYGNKDEKCFSYFSNIVPDGRKSHFSEDIKNLIILLISLTFSITGYFLLIRYNKKETEKVKKYFLRLIILYFIIGYLVMLPVSGERMSYVEYLRFSFFMPYVFLGFLTKWMSERFPKIYMLPAIIIFFLLVFSNAAAISEEVSQLLDKTRTCLSHLTTLGEIEPVADYMISRSDGRNMLYFGVDTESLPAFMDPLKYLFKRQNIDSYNVGTDENYLWSIDKPAFVLGCQLKKSYPYPYERIDGIYIYQINN